MIATKDVLEGITWCQAALAFLSWGHALLVAAWVLMGILSGFCQGILHIPPAAYEVLLIKIASDCIGFRVTMKPDTKRSAIFLCVAMLIGGILLNAVHGVFSIIELASDSVRNYPDGLLIAFVVIIAVVMAIEGFMIHYFIKMRRYVAFLGKTK